MSDHAETYNEIVRRAREENIRDLIRRTETQLFREIIKALEPDFRDTLPDNKDAFIARYIVATQQLQDRTADVIEEAIRISAERSTDAHIEAHTALDGLDDDTLRQVTAALRDVPETAIQATFQRRSLGSVRTFQSLRQWPSTAQVVETAIDDMIREGQSYQRASQRIMRGLVTGDEDLARIARTYGPNGGLRRWAQEAGIQPNQQAQAVARRLGYDAKRIARTEIAQSYHEADRLSGMRSPVTKGLKWTLAPNRDLTDICDLYAAQDLYNLGEGVYPPEDVPQLAHPHCRCHLRYVFRDEDEWDQPKEQIERKEDPNPNHPSVSDVSDAHRRRIIRQLQQNFS